MIDYNSRCADEYAHQQGLESERQEAIEQEVSDMLDSLDDRFAAAITRQMAENRQFEIEIDALALERILERNKP